MLFKMRYVCKNPPGRRGRNPYQLIDYSEDEELERAIHASVLVVEQKKVIGLFSLHVFCITSKHFVSNIEWRLYK